MTVYFISGLGADERVFQFLSLPGISKKFIKWITPEENESIKQYAQRLICQIDLNDKVVLIGISFGGIVAQEIASIVKCEKVIIISSVKSPTEFNWQLTLVKRSGIYKLFPAKFLKWSNKLTADYYFSTESKRESDLLRQIINDTDEKFMSWAICRIMDWRNDNMAGPIVHIHGTSDRIFPPDSIRNAITIDKGGHFMIVSKSEQISKIIMEEIEKIKYLPVQG